MCQINSGSGGVWGEPHIHRSDVLRYPWHIRAIRQVWARLGKAGHGAAVSDSLVKPHVRPNTLNSDDLRDKSFHLWHHIRIATLTIDSHEFITGLTAAGVPQAQAEAIAQGFSKVNLESVATKQDVSELRLELRDVKVELLKWIVPLLLGQIVAFAAIVKWLLV